MLKSLSPLYVCRKLSHKITACGSILFSSATKKILLRSTTKICNTAFTTPFFLLINVSGYRQIKLTPGKPGRRLTPTARSQPTPATRSGSLLLCHVAKLVTTSVWQLLTLYFCNYIDDYLLLRHMWHVTANDSSREALSKIEPNGSSRTKK